MDHCEKRKRKRDPRDRAGLLSLITFFYSGSIFKKALKKDLEEDNLCEAVGSCNSKRCGDKLEDEWHRLKKKSPAATAFGLLYHRYVRQYFFLGILDLSYQLGRAYLEPEAVSQLTGYFSSSHSISKGDAYYYGGVVLFIYIFSCFFMHNYYLMLQKFALKVRTAFSALVYRKALRLSPGALTDISLGNIVTIVTKDVSAFEENVWTINDMWVGAVKCLYVSYLVYAKMGPTSLIGIGLFFMVLPLQIYFAKVVVNMRLKMNKKTDDRLQIMQEVLSAIKIIKMYTWECFFDQKVTEARRKELMIMMKNMYIRVIVILIGLFSSKVAFYVLITVYIAFGYKTDVEMVFYVLTCLEGLRQILAIDIPYGLSRGAEMWAALIRLTKVLNAEEIHDLPSEDVDKPSIDLKEVHVDIKDNHVLENVSLKLHSSLVLMTGTVGSGKSSLIKTILGDYPKKSGTVTVHGTVSYASQDPWLFPSTVRQNILFGEKFCQSRYDEVVRVCALKYDFDCLEHADETIVADRGLNLSKGQQARINLARAVYRNSNIYLLDDSLTALDANIQDYIFRECIRGFLKDKLCVLVTQNVAHLGLADEIIVMEDKRVSYFGPPDQKGMDTKVTKEEAATEESKEKDDGPVEEGETTPGTVYQETKKQGGVDYAIYTKYFRFGGGLLAFAGIMALCVVAQSTESYSSKLITRWVDENQLALDLSNDTNSTEYQESLQVSKQTINIYSGTILLSIVLDCIRYYFLLNFTRVASLNIHKAMTSSIINAVMPFFDTHFIGNILNRFSQDLNNVDEMLPMILLEVIRILFETMAIIFVISTVNWRFLAPALLFLLISFILRQLYMPTGRSLKRLEAITRSPLIGHLNSSLEGLTTIRAFKQQDILRQEFEKHQDLFTSAHFMMLCTQRAFEFLVEIFCTMLISFIVVRFLFFETDTSAGDVGLVLNQVMILTESVQWGIRQWADLENNMTSVERVLEYTETRKEPRTGDILENWPVKGEVAFKDVSLTYSNNEMVLRNLSFALGAGQKIGIVGRTGAGKSSIISTLFRLYDLEGEVVIDNIDTKTLNVQFLRNCIAIIPQDPVLFSGTMRTNIDPLKLYADQEIWEALEKVKLKTLVPSLDLPINEKGSNFSSGQRQLICLARAIIRKNRIVVLDEATANMDPKTDALLHDTIKENFRDCTVFIIAHRLHSIIDADKILVLSRGEIVECDTPEKLLENDEGYFAKMVAKSNI